MRLRLQASPAPTLVSDHSVGMVRVYFSKVYIYEVTHLLICDPAKKDNFPSHNLWRNFGNIESSPARYSFHKLDWSSLSASGSWQMLQIWGAETVFWSTQQIIFCREAPVVFTFCCALDNKPPSLSLSANLFLCSITVFFTVDNESSSLHSLLLGRFWFASKSQPQAHFSRVLKGLTVMQMLAVPELNQMWPKQTQMWAN